jgi:hypothetical protein
MEKLSQDNRANLLVQFPNLPLAMYREIAAHLCQVEAVETNLLPASNREFNYNDSQVESLQILLPVANLQSREQVEQILAYYQNIFGSMERY